MKPDANRRFFYFQITVAKYIFTLYDTIKSRPLLPQEVCNMFDLATFRKLAIRPGDRFRIHAYDDRKFSACIVRTGNRSFEVMNPSVFTPPFTVELTIDMLKSMELILRAETSTRRGTGMLFGSGQRIWLPPYNGKELHGDVIAAMSGFAIVKPDRSILSHGWYYMQATRLHANHHDIERAHHALQPL